MTPSRDAIASLILVVLVATVPAPVPRKVDQRAATPAPKGNRLTPIRPAEAAIVAPPPEPPEPPAEPPPRPSEPSPPPAAPPRPDAPVPPPRVAARPTDICARHGGWRVVTDGGRSWRCAYNGGAR